MTNFDFRVLFPLTVNPYLNLSIELTSVNQCIINIFLIAWFLSCELFQHITFSSISERAIIKCYFFFFHVPSSCITPRSSLASKICLYVQASHSRSSTAFYQTPLRITMVFEHWIATNFKQKNASLISSLFILLAVKGKSCGFSGRSARKGHRKNATLAYSRNLTTEVLPDPAKNWKRYKIFDCCIQFSSTAEAWCRKDNK